jgi:uncharacterized coiled-coil protein SlyX
MNKYSEREYNSLETRVKKLETQLADVTAHLITLNHVVSALLAHLSDEDIN